MGRLTSELVISINDRATAPARGIAAAVARMQQQIRDNNARMEAMRGRMLETAAAGYALFQAISRPVTAAGEFGSMLEDIGQKANIAQSSLVSVGREIREVGLRTAQGATAVGKSVDFLMGMGASQQAAVTMAEPIGRGATAYRAATEDLAAAAFAVTDNLKVPAEQAAYALDIMAAGGKEGGFELRDMAAEFPAITAAAQALGIKGTKGVADLVAMLEVARKGAGSGSEAATNLQNFLSKIASKETIGNFKKFGINVTKEMEKAEKSGVSVVEHMLGVIDKVTKGGRPELLAQLFGDMQVQQFIRPMLANMEEYQRIRATALEAAGTVQTDFDRRMNTYGGSVLRFQAQLENLSIVVGSTLLPAISAVIDAVAPLIERMARFAEANPRLVASVVGVTSALVALRVAAFAARFSLLWMKGGVLSAGVMGLSALAAASGSVSRQQRAMQAASRAAAVANVAQAQAMLTQRQAAFKAARGVQELAEKGRVAGTNLAQSTANLKAAGHAALAAQRDLTAANVALAATAPAATAATAALRVLKVALIGTGIGAALVAIGAAGSFIYQNWSGIQAMFAGIADGIRTAFPAASGIIDTVSESVRGLFEWFGKLTGPIDAAEAEWRAFGVQIGTTIGEAVAAVAAMPARLLEILSSIDLSGAGLAMMNTLLEGIRNGATAVLDYARSIGSSIRSSVSGAVSGAVSSIRSAVGLGESAAPPQIDGARAAGGPVAAGRTYLVGEKGPELFVPRETGEIVANDGLGRASSRASQIGARFREGLSVRVRPEVDTSSIDGLIAKVDRARAGLRSLGSETRGAASRAGQAAEDYDHVNADIED